MKLVHAADLHLDSPLRGLERYEGAPIEALRSATRRALSNLVELCLSERAEVLVVAGDLYDGDWRDYHTGLYFASQLGRLREAGVRVFLVRGNHDAASQLTRALRLPEGVVDFPTDRPETHVLEPLGLAVHGQGFATRAVTEDLGAAYPPPVPGLFNVGLLHTSVDGREGHEPYAPCRLEALVNKGYDYWALGHVHRREVLHVHPWVVFSGNLQGRHARETGPKGATLVTVEGGKALSVEHRPLDVVRWAQCVVDASACRSGDDVVDRVRETVGHYQREAEGRTLALRVVVQGHSDAHGPLGADPERWRNEVRAAASEASGGEAWVEKVLVRTQPRLDLEALRRRDDPLGSLVRNLADLREDPQARAWAWDQLASLRRKLPAEYHQLEGALRLDHPSGLKPAFDEVERLLLALLPGSES